MLVGSSCCCCFSTRWMCLCISIQGNLQESLHMHYMIGCRTETKKPGVAVVNYINKGIMQMWTNLMHYTIITQLYRSPEFCALPQCLSAHCFDFLACIYTVLVNSHLLASFSAAAGGCFSARELWKTHSALPDVLERADKSCCRTQGFDFKFFKKSSFKPSNWTDSFFSFTSVLINLKTLLGKLKKNPNPNSSLGSQSLWTLL